MTSPTVLKFGYPRSLVAETSRWLVLLRPNQPTLGSLALRCKEPAQSFSRTSANVIADPTRVVRGLGLGLKRLVQYVRIDYSMPGTAAGTCIRHAIRRRGGERMLEGERFVGAAWLGAAVLSSAVEPASTAPAALRPAA